jgi:amyloid beta A4 protein
MHQQRVISRINQRKKLSMACFTNALNQTPLNTHRVQKCLQKLLRSLHKDRHHTIQHFRHLLETNFDQVRPIGAISSGLLSQMKVFLKAERERDITIEHLGDIDRLVNESLVMLARYEELVTSFLSKTNVLSLASPTAIGKIFPPLLTAL